MAETRLALFLLVFSLLSIFRFGRVDSVISNCSLGCDRGKPNLRKITIWRCGGQCRTLRRD